jgi:hypothetical protein
MRAKLDWRPGRAVFRWVERAGFVCCLWELPKESPEKAIGEKELAQ